MNFAVSQTVANEIIAGRYRVAARIGSGGMGEVFRARDQVLGRTVAVKVLPQELAARQGFVERFRAEAQAAARLSHPNAVQVYDWGSSDGSYFMVMEYVRGRTLREVLAARGRVEPAQAAALLSQLLAALEAAHASGLVHRDIKPENILLTAAGEVKVTDFGISRMAEAAATSSDMLGTASYVSPEQIRGEAVDGRADLYAAGCVLYELLCGAPPFEGNVAHVLHEHLTARVPQASVEVPDAAPLDAVVALSTEPDSAARYPSATAMRSALAEVAASLPEAPPLSELASEITSLVATEAQETMIPPLPRHKPRRRRWPLLVAVLLVLVVGAGAVMLRPVPRVAGLRQADAIAKLRGAGLHTRVGTAFDDTAPLGTVVAARPPFSVGPLGLRGSTVRLTVSKGQDLRQVPLVEGQPLAAAQQAIRAAGLPGPVVAEDFNPAPKGTVVHQEPPPQAVKPGTPITLKVSKGPEMVGVPAVVSGTAYPAALSTLSAAGLSAVRQETYNDAAAETVLGQAPAAGTSVPKGSAVTLTVSVGPQPFPMPNVASGATCAAARSQLEGLGLVVTVKSPSGACTTNPVLLQDLPAGSSVRKGDAVTLYVP
ncbi:MAG: eukaryotic-like serine/threonine-protein kinase [Actinomycetota bacterium]|nr:eukaryotic-like serine/threonine-protein kinase [Actinomycetota bacterium]